MKFLSSIFTPLHPIQHYIFIPVITSAYSEIERGDGYAWLREKWIQSPEGNSDEGEISSWDSWFRWRILAARPGGIYEDVACQSGLNYRIQDHAFHRKGWLSRTFLTVRFGRFKGCNFFGVPNIPFFLDGLSVRGKSDWWLGMILDKSS